MNMFRLAYIDVIQAPIYLTHKTIAAFGRGGGGVDVCICSSQVFSSISSRSWEILKTPIGYLLLIWAHHKMFATV